MHLNTRPAHVYTFEMHRSTRKRTGPSLADVLRVDGMMSTIKHTCTYGPSGGARKQPRMVDKATEKAVNADEDTYDLYLGYPEKPFNDGVTAFIKKKKIKLKFLNVYVSADIDQAGVSSSYFTGKEFGARLLSFLDPLTHGKKHSLSGVTTLCFTSNCRATSVSSTSSPQSYSATRLDGLAEFSGCLLGLLASRLKNIECLAVSGPANSATLKAVGGKCKKLVHIEIEPDPASLQGFGSTFPSANTLSLRESVLRESSTEERQRNGIETLRAIASATALTTLDTGPDFLMSQAAWAALPPGIRRLTAAGCVQHELSPAVSHGLSSICPDIPALGLTKLEMNCGIEQLSRILLAAPRLTQVIGTASVSSGSGAQKGWATVVEEATARGLKGLNVLEVCGDCTHPFFDFLSKAEPLPGVRSVEILNAHPQSAVSFECFKDLTRVFPDLNSLLLRGVKISDRSLKPLHRCEHLRYVRFCKCGQVTPLGVLFLSLIVPNLIRIDVDQHLMSGPCQAVVREFVEDFAADLKVCITHCD